MTALRTFAATAAVAATAALVGATSAPAASGCRLVPEKRTTVAGHYRVVIDRCPTTVAVNRTTFWRIRVTTRAGKPYAGRVEVGGGMPEHGHGFLTPPVVTRGAPGVVHARLVFAMRGRWVIELRFVGRKRDVVRYEVTV